MNKVLFNINSVTAGVHWRTYKTKYSRMDQVKFVEDSLWRIGRDMVWLSRPYPFKFFKGCLLQILLGPFLNTLSHLYLVLEMLEIAFYLTLSAFIISFINIIFHYCNLNNYFFLHTTRSGLRSYSKTVTLLYWIVVSDYSEDFGNYYPLENKLSFLLCKLCLYF